MKKLVAASCAAILISAVSLPPVSAQTTGPSGGQDAAMKSNNPMNAQAKAKTKQKKGAMNQSSGTTTGSSGAATNTTGGAASMNNKK